MGYANPPPASSYLKVAGQLTSVVYNAVLSDETCGTITLPNYQGVVSRATMDLAITKIEDTSGAANVNDFPGALQISSGGWHDCVTVEQQVFSLTANQKIYSDIILKGTTDIKSYIAPGTTYNLQISNTRCTGATLVFYCCGVLNLYFE